MRRWVGFMVLGLVACGGVEFDPAQSGEQSESTGPYVCSPMTCRGCCSGNVCLSGAEQLACGYEGRACRQCGRGTHCVAPGTCATPSNDEIPGSQDPSTDVPIDPMTGMPMTGPLKRCIGTPAGYYCTGQ